MADDEIELQAKLALHQTFKSNFLMEKFDFLYSCMEETPCVDKTLSTLQRKSSFGSKTQQHLTNIGCQEYSMPTKAQTI